MSSDGWAESTVLMPDPDGVTPGQMIAFMRSVFGDGPVLQLRQYTEERAAIKLVDSLIAEADGLRGCHFGQEAALVRNIANGLDPRRK